MITPIRGRVRARRCAVQALYQWQLAGHDPRDIIKEFVAERELVNVDMDYFSTLTREIPAHVHELQSDLQDALDRPFQELDPIERGILLIGAYELRYSPEIPWRVVINEAIELTKMFGAEQAHKYVNGVLDKVVGTSRSAEMRALSRG
ncbi:MAG: N utilization substance protein B [Chromatiales bacterium USCg_Taylor]|jgi:N utilization substance protein B|nr:MAG: N utilization substance protein B [Chromatiales bacterium USCg_Taylor]